MLFSGSESTRSGKLKIVKEGGRDTFLIEEQKQLYETFTKARRDIPLLQEDITAAEAKPAEYLKVRCLLCDSCGGRLQGWACLLCGGRLCFPSPRYLIFWPWFVPVLVCRYAKIAL